MYQEPYDIVFQESADPKDPTGCKLGKFKTIYEAVMPKSGDYFGFRHQLLLGKLYKFHVENKTQSES